MGVGGRIGIWPPRIHAHAGMEAPDIAPLGGVRRSLRRLGRMGGWRQG